MICVHKLITDGGNTDAETLQKKTYAALPAERLFSPLLHCEVVRTIFFYLAFLKNVLATGLSEHG